MLSRAAAHAAARRAAAAVEVAAARTTTCCHRWKVQTLSVSKQRPARFCAAQKRRLRRELARGAPARSAPLSSAHPDRSGLHQRPGRRLKAARAHLPAQTARAPRASDAPAWTVSRSRNPHLMCRHSVLARSGGGRVAPCLSASAGSQRRMSSKGGPAGSGSCPGAATCTACAASHAVHNKLRGTSAATAHIQGTPLP